jgi:hypothetical protein
MAEHAAEYENEFGYPWLLSQPPTLIEASAAPGDVDTGTPDVDCQFGNITVPAGKMGSLCYIGSRGYAAPGSDWIFEGFLTEIRTYYYCSGGKMILSGFSNQYMHTGPCGGQYEVWP